MSKDTSPAIQKLVHAVREARRALSDTLETIERTRARIGGEWYVLYREEGPVRDELQRRAQAHYAVNNAEKALQEALFREHGL